MSNLMWNISNQKFKVKVEPMKQYNNKLWVKIIFADGTVWVPSFADLLRIIQPLYEVEEVKYPHDKQKGGDMVKDFLIDCCQPAPDLKKLWDKLKTKYEMVEVENQREINFINKKTNNNNNIDTHYNKIAYLLKHTNIEKDHIPDCPICDEPLEKIRIGSVNFVYCNSCKYKYRVDIQLCPRECRDNTLIHTLSQYIRLN